MLALTAPDESDSHGAIALRGRLHLEDSAPAHRHLAGRSDVKQWIAICAVSMSSAL
jgi:hypothetical protein